VFQQDSAPSHTASTTQEWLAENFHDHVTPNIWPPSSPDLNPLDYYVWGVVERETNKHAHNTKDSLKAAIGDIMANINKDHLINACSRFRSRIEAVIEVEGGFIE
jgi:inhibitor of nuclear factor kappa-B kinase subunit alpha